MDICSFIINTLISAIGAFIGIFGSYIIYRSQQKNEQDKERIAKRNKQLNLLKYYRILLNEVIATAEIKTSCIDNYIKEQSKNFAKISPIKTVSNNDFIRIKNIDYSFLFDTWNDLMNSEDKIKEFCDLQAKLDYIEGIFSNMDLIYEENARKGFTVLTDTSNTLKDFVLDLGCYLMNKEMQGTEYNINTILSNYSEEAYKNYGSPDFTLNEVKKILLNPISTIVEKQPKSLPNYLLALLSKMMNSLNEVEMQTKYVLEQLKQPKEEIDNHLKDIQSFIDRIEKIK